jgi:hypothetical protein
MVIFCVTGTYQNSGNDRVNTSPRYFCVWIKDWEVACLSKKDPLVEQRLLQKYGGHSFFNEEVDIFFDLLFSNMQFQYQRKYHGCMVLVTPPAYIGDGSDDNLI